MQLRWMIELLKLKGRCVRGAQAQTRDIVKVVEKLLALSSGTPSEYQTTDFHLLEDRD